MTFDETVAALEAAVAAAWGAAPRWENVAAPDPAPTSPWLAAELHLMRFEQRSIGAPGSNAAMRAGVLRLVVWVPRAARAETASARSSLAALVAALRNTSAGGLLFASDSTEPTIGPPVETFTPITAAIGFQAEAIA